MIIRIFFWIAVVTSFVGFYLNNKYLAFGGLVTCIVLLLLWPKKKVEGQLICSGCKRRWDRLEVTITRTEFLGFDTETFICPHCRKANPLVD